MIENSKLIKDIVSKKYENISQSEAIIFNKKHKNIV